MVCFFLLPWIFLQEEHPEYKTLPPVGQGCSLSKNLPVMEFIYSYCRNKNIHPRDQTGELTRVHN